MPLIHSKRPAAFKKNIETEMEHGKPQKQAVAIAYKMAGEHKAHGGEMCAHGGPVKCNAGCYAKGGDVDGPAEADEALDDPMEHEAGESEGHEEIESQLAEELLHAMEKKDKRGVVSAIEALVLQCMNKGGM